MAINRDIGSAGSPVAQREPLQAVVEMMLASDLARSQALPLHHSPESLTRSPAKMEILISSLIVFIERGVVSVTVQDLLDAAKISRRTFYKYFRNKVDVLESLYKLAVDIMIVRHQADIGSARTVTDVARNLVNAFYGYHQELGPVIRMMQEEALRTDSPLHPHRVSAMAVVVSMVNQELKRTSGRTIDPLAIQALLWAMESISIEYLRGTTASVQTIAHARDVMAEIVDAAFQRAMAGAIEHNRG